MIGLGERLLARMPIVRSVSGSVKQVFETVLKGQSGAFRDVVLVEFPRIGSWTMGLVAGRPEGELKDKLPEDMVTVYVPTSPNPTSGYILFVPRVDTIRVDMSVDECLRMVLSGGLALANAGLGAVHDFAAPIGGRFPAPHGAVCAALLPVVMAANLRALRERAPQSVALRRYEEIARLLTGRAQATADDGVAWVKELCAALAVAPLRTLGLSESDVASVVASSQQASSMKANPIALSEVELRDVLTAAL